MRLLIITIMLICSLPVTGLDLPKLSGKFLFQVKTGKSQDSIPAVFRQMTAEQIAKALTNDTKKKTFWINMYNAWYQVLAQRGLKPPQIFTVKALSFKDFSLSLDDIEHGILRKHRWKYSLGYFGQLAPGKIILLLTVNSIDFRIHFALNCGARSCPPIAFYEEALLNEQLELATRSFLQNETKVDSGKKVVQVTKIMQWFSGDFGGGSGQLKILSTYLGRDFSGYRIVYKDYDWTADLMNFSLTH
ncbi:MAG: DUF547 domain-containing protein [Cyclobacteriaceae bacterium]